MSIRVRKRLAHFDETIYGRFYMPTISNKTTKPLSVPLPGGKTLHLGPKASGEVSPRAAEHAPLKKLIDAGEVEVVAGGAGTGRASGGGRKGRTFEQGGHALGRGSHRRGDR
jgi:hypothetical protein